MSFPTCGILDDFNRTNESPLSFGGKWSVVIGSLRVLSNECTVNLGGGTEYWNVTTFTDSECYVTIPTVPAEVSQGIEVMARMDFGAGSGYSVIYSKAAGTDAIYLMEYVSGIPTPLATYAQEVSNGDAIGIECIGTAIRAWYKASAGSWTALGSAVTDATNASGYVGLSGYDQELVGFGYMDDFGGGTVVVGETFLTGVHFMEC